MLSQDLLNDLQQLDSHEQQSSQESMEIEPNTQLIVSALLVNDDFLNHMDSINQLIDLKLEKANLRAGSGDESAIIHQSNHYASEIDREIKALMRSVKALYKERYPEIQGIVVNSALYCKTVKEVEESSIKNIAPEHIKLPYLAPHQAISVKLVLAAQRPALSASAQHEILSITNSVALLQQHHNVLMMYLESCMRTVAPNLCQLLGSLTASKLISAAGSVMKLANIPSCNIQVIGGERAAQVGLGMLERHHTGLFGHMDVVKDAPKRFQMQLVRMLASNASKCAKADALKTSPNLGEQLREEMYQRFQKVQEEGGLTRMDKPLEVPDMQPKKRRGGKRYRKSREAMQMSELRKVQNRLKFGAEAQVEIANGVGLGMLKAGAGKLKIGIKKTKLHVSKATQARMEKKSGLQSSLNLGSTRGIELIDPSAKSAKPTVGTDSYFSKQLGFKTVLTNKLAQQK